MRLLLFVLFFVLANDGHAISVQSGTLATIEQFPSKFVSKRNIHIWLPEDYNESNNYAVLYMHDGQMLFDASTTWNKQEWGVDETAARLNNTSNIRPFIVVGIDNGGPDRHRDYYPQKPFNLLSIADQKRFYQIPRDESQLLFNGAVNSDNYLKFLVQELKPYIDENYAVDTSKNSTFIMGSSMGGLISLYAINEYPDVFGGAACISTHWLGVMPHEGNPAPNTFYQYLTNSLTKLSDHKIYFDYGNKTLDEHYPPLQKHVDLIMKSKGFTKENWQTLFFDGHAHTEEAWQSRLEKPISFLMKKK
ncbi:alpha/beta hydrolase [Thalassotalea sp. M1531]|uniref:Alpha/beta hydrolase n=1 Tax=Thalassotalea algicola TaxID=2716224 RepID=A0A7Y0Q6X3_9GAMM|nr:alpha/beta hydrolase-fold protein [Thalassotalea algicola]NMP30440.1 alpha/beta hydrolase [Thalassotalea algicola]